MKYKYQMHTHTYPCSLCSKMSSEELAKSIGESDYSGVVITNHFIGGNTGIDRKLEWVDFVKAFENDYERCKEAAKEYDIDILFGVEENVDKGREILVYGLTPEILYQNEKLRNHRIADWREIADRHGLLIVQAHPYRERPYIVEPGVLPIDMLDGIEVYNLYNKPEENEKAEKLAAMNPNLILLSGADAHNPAPALISGIACEERMRNEKDLVRILKSGKYDLIVQ